MICGVPSSLQYKLRMLLGNIEESPKASATSSLLYRFTGRRMLFVAGIASNKSEQFALVGANIYYFNDFDANQRFKTIHEGFIGVTQSDRGLGIATALREAAFNHFKDLPLSGITTRIRSSNKPSLASAQKLGFCVSSEFQKNELTSDEYYLYRSFR
jgi:RimJ/RimL family protein N-acetyltransferase